MTETIFSVEAECRSVQTKGLSQMKMTFDSQENLSEHSLATIAKWHGKTGHLLFLVEPPKAEDIAGLPELEADEFGKTPAQRLRGKIWKLWKMRSESGHWKGSAPSSDQFYRDVMEALGNEIDRKCV